MYNLTLLIKESVETKTPIKFSANSTQPFASRFDCGYTVFEKENRDLIRVRTKNIESFTYSYVQPTVAESSPEAETDTVRESIQIKQLSEQLAAANAVINTYRQELKSIKNTLSRIA